jgi:soluble lytic murein transglycosylase-like protein
LTCVYFYVQTPQKVEIEVEKIVEIVKQEEKLEDLLREIPEAYGVPEMIARAIVRQESGGKMNSIRFEPGQMARAGKFTKNVEQQRMLASSHCALQVMGWHAPGLGIDWTDLYKPRTCMEAGMKILADCMKRSKNDSKYQTYHRALACYNGSEKYANEVMTAVATELIERSL